LNTGFLLFLAMPELPDIEVFSKNLKQLYAGKKLSRVRVVNGKKLKDSPKALSAALEGKKVQDIFRSGKEMRVQFSGGVLLGIHLMLTGDLHAFEKKNGLASTIVEFHFADGTGLALTDRMKNANVTLDPVDKKGIDALDKALNFKKLKELLNRKANIKNVLLDQNTIRGIGNGYSDEILWKSGISPFSIAAAIPDEKIKELGKNIRQVLGSAAKAIDKKYPGLIQGEVRDFMKIHTRHKTESPTGAPIKMVKRGMLKTYFTDEQVLYQ
jgi:formamidopyrimidine-DNA glycosylase